MYESCPLTVVRDPRLGRQDLAQQAFERVLKLEPNNAHGLVGLAIVELNSGKADSVHRAMGLLKRAYESDPTNPLVLNHLSNHFFYKKDYDKVTFVCVCRERVLYTHVFHHILLYLLQVMSLAQNAFNHTQVREMKAESFYYFGRAYHVQKKYDEAFKVHLYIYTIIAGPLYFYPLNIDSIIGLVLLVYIHIKLNCAFPPLYQFYSNAVELWPEYVLAQYGLGQMHLFRSKCKSIHTLTTLVVKASFTRYSQQVNMIKPYIASN